MMRNVASCLVAFCVAITLGTPSSALAECDASVTASAPNSRFRVHQSAIEVEDLQTGLTWQQCALGEQWAVDGCVIDDAEAGLFSWPEALAAAESQPGWRLPNKKELASIIEYQCRFPALNTQLFPQALDASADQRYWTSTPLIYFSQPTVWVVDFANGAFANGTPDQRLKVRLVKD